MKILAAFEFVVLIALASIIVVVIIEEPKQHEFNTAKRIQLLNLVNVSLVATPHTRAINTNLWWFAAHQTNVVGESNVIDCETVSFINETTRYYPHRLFCSSFFGDTSSFMTDKYESMFECGRTDHAHFHCASTTHIYDYCVTWADVGTACRRPAITNETILYNHAVLERPVPGDQAEVVYVYVTLSINGIVCIHANSSAVPGVLHFVHGDFKLALDTRGKIRCTTEPIVLVGALIRLDNFYMGDYLTQHLIL
jgi:hypothetical protein